jgi:hypothetical protein
VKEPKAIKPSLHIPEEIITAVFLLPTLLSTTQQLTALTMRFSIFATAFAAALSVGSTLAAPTDASSRDVEDRQLQAVVAVIGAVVNAYEGISNVINEEINKDNAVCRFFPSL